MGKIYDALKHAREERDSFHQNSSKEQPPRNIHKTPTHKDTLTSAKQTSTSRREESRGQKVTAESAYAAFDRRLVTFSDPRSVSAEQFRKIRAFLSQLQRAKGYRSIMVTSTVPREGKTIIACNLAASITQGLDNQAFLIDCDLRDPGVHMFFGLERNPGLAELLTAKSDFSQVVREVHGLKLKVITAGKSPESPGELLSSDKMISLLQDLKTKYSDHYIILDTTPVALTAEVGAIARAVDGIILVILLDKTPKALVQRALKEIPKDKIIGIVANGVHFTDGYFPRYHYEYNKDRHRASDPHWNRRSKI